jgi:hypothetical protein
VTEELTSLRQVRSVNRTRVHLVLSEDVSEYIYPGTHDAIEKVVLKVRRELDNVHVDFDIITALDDMVAVVDPRRTSSEAISILRRFHQKQIESRFLHRIFVDGYVVIPDKEILSVHTDKNKVFVFMSGSCWEITPSNELVSVATVPDQGVLDVRLGSHRLTHSRFSFTAHSAYAQNISFPKEGNGPVPAAASS